MSINTPARLLLPWATLEKERVQSFSRSLVPEPALCVKVSPTISNWYCSTRDLMFHVPRTSLMAGVGTPRSLPLPNTWHTTHPTPMSIHAGGRQNSDSVVFFRLCPAKTQGTSTLASPRSRSGSRRGPWSLVLLPPLMDMQADVFELQATEDGDGTHRGNMSLKATTGPLELLLGFVLI